MSQASQVRAVEKDNSYQENLIDLQLNSLPYIAATLALIACVLLLWIPGRPGQTQRQDMFGSLLMVLAFLTLLLRKYYPLGTWVFVSGFCVVVFASGLIFQDRQLNYLLAVPCILVPAYLGTRSGIFFGFLVTVLLSLSTYLFTGNFFDRAFFLQMIINWMGISLVWTALRPLRTITAESWLYYQTAQAFLEQSRARQVELNQANEDLSSAYKELGRLNQVVIASQKATDEAKRAKEAFVANVSHELRTPLNMIIGFSSIITRTPLTYRKKLPPELLADISAIQRNAEHLSKLVDDVLDLSKADAGYMKLVISLVSIPGLIDEAISSVKNLFENKNLWIRTEIEADLPEIACDSTRIKQVVLNLLSNAGRFVEQGGITLQAKREKSQVVVSVSDTGPGIPETEIGQLFEPFRQLETDYQVKKGGTGLGLAISKKFVELHGGRMWAESVPGQGSTFSFSLPVFTAEQVEGGPGRWLSRDYIFHNRMSDRRLNLPKINKRVLFLDPEEGLYSLASIYLKDQVEVALARNQEEADQDLARLTSHLFVVNDAHAQEKQDYASYLQGVPAQLPVIFCSTPDHSSFSTTLGVYRYLTKPILFESLMEAIDSIETPVSTILIAEDNPEALQLFSRMLLSHGKNYTVLRASDGQRALELIQTVHPDLILLDMILPGINGFQILSAVQQNPSLADIKVIVISAQDPIGEPVTSDHVAFYRSSGLTGREILDIILGLTEIVSPIFSSQGPEQPDKLLE
jgi:signal transduction histidine kinase/CheY-like chemotaxis protein